MLGMQPPQGGAAPAGYGAPPGAPPGVMPAVMGAPGMMPGGPGMMGPPPGMMGPSPGMGPPPGMMGPPPGMMGPQGVMPASYEGMGYPPIGMEMGCPSCGGAGCPGCLGGHGVGDHMERGFDILRYLLPYPGGGWCSPRWFDVSAEFMYLGRDDVEGTINFTSDGPRGLGAPNIVLSTDDLDFDERPGFRASAAFQLGSSGNIEFTYFGTFNWADSAFVTNDFDELYSAFSDFGSFPPAIPGVSPPGFQDTDAADFASIAYSSSIDSYDLGFRRRWMFPNCRVQGSWIAGARYVRLEEEFRHIIHVDYDQGGGIPDFEGALSYLVGTDNSMTGFQLGGDMWATLFPGVMIGLDGRAGVYGNRADQTTVIRVASTDSHIVETEDSIRTSFVGEAGFYALWRLNQHFTLKGGYQVLLLDGVALAPAQVNFETPLAGNTRPVFLNDEQDLFYDGFTAGLEYLW